MPIGNSVPDAPAPRAVRENDVATITNLERDFLPSLQAVRAVAALLVLLFHSTEVAATRLHFTLFGNAFSWGNCGVDLFFVLSGFVISYVHAGDVGRPERWRSYLLKRLIRIFPLYWLLLGGLVVATFALPSLFPAADREWERIIKGFALFPQHDLPLLGVAWTLSHELFFYGLFSLVIWRFDWLTRGVLAAVLVGSLVVCFLQPTVAMRVSPVPTLPLAVTFCFHHFNLEFALGVAVAILFRRGKRSEWTRSLAIPCLMIAVGVALFVLRAGYPQAADGFLPAPLYRVLTYGVGAALVIMAGLCLDSTKRGAWLFRPLSPIGDSSYALYLVHYPWLSALTLLLARQLDGEVSTTAFYVVAMLAVILAAWVLHICVERRLLTALRTLLLPRRQRISG